MKIGIIGAGWYGSHLALILKKRGHEVTLFEKNSDIFQQISGKFGVRLHAGPHYPRSAETRKSCRRGFDEFYKAYPELIIEHEYSTYGLGNRDANNEPPKVNQQEFEAVGEESKNSSLIVPEAWGYSNLMTAINIKEPSIAVGQRLRETFRKYLKEANVKVTCNYNVQKLDRICDKIAISNGVTTEVFDQVINATSYQSLLPDELGSPFDLDVVYQPCLALEYEDTQPLSKPFSFIVMDGWFPCLMPYNNKVEEKKKGPHRDYILTHGKWTIMGSFKTTAEADQLLNALDDQFIQTKIKPFCEAEMKRFWPEFLGRFKYRGWRGSVLAKIKTNREFRSAVTFKKDGVIHIIPGKVSNIFDAEREVLSLLQNQNTISQGSYQYVQGGVLYDSMTEITEKVDPAIRNTCNLQTFAELLHEPIPSAIKKPDRQVTPFWTPPSPRRNEPLEDVAMGPPRDKQTHSDTAVGYS